MSFRRYSMPFGVSVSGQTIAKACGFDAATRLIGQ
jgi:hypothetical protein